jgi:hypothetical protein
MWMSAPLATSRGVAGRIEPPLRTASQTVRDHDCAAERVTGRSHHARSVSISRSTCIASARSASSAASSSASARIVAAALRRAASMRAVRTTVDTGVPSRVKTARASDASSSGRKVIVSAMAPIVLQIVRQDATVGFQRLLGGLSPEVCWRANRETCSWSSSSIRAAHTLGEEKIPNPLGSTRRGQTPPRSEYVEIEYAGLPVEYRIFVIMLRCNPFHCSSEQNHRSTTRNHDNDENVSQVSSHPSRRHNVEFGLLICDNGLAASIETTGRVPPAV